MSGYEIPVSCDDHVECKFDIILNTIAWSEREWLMLDPKSEGFYGTKKSRKNNQFSSRIPTLSAFKEP